MGGDLLQHCHQILIRHLPNHDLTLQHVQGSLIALYVEGVAVELRLDQEEKERVREHAENKDVPEFMGTKLI